MLDRYNSFPYTYQSTIGYGTLIQNVILIKLRNIDVELKK